MRKHRQFFANDGFSLFFLTFTTCFIAGCSGKENSVDAFLGAWITSASDTEWGVRMFFEVEFLEDKTCGVHAYTYADGGGKKLLSREIGSYNVDVRRSTITFDGVLSGEEVVYRFSQPDHLFLQIEEHVDFKLQRSPR